MGSRSCLILFGVLGVCVSAIYGQFMNGFGGWSGSGNGFGNIFRQQQSTMLRDPFTDVFTDMSSLDPYTSVMRRNYRYASCVFNSTIQGRLDFQESVQGSAVRVKIQLRGLPMLPFGQMDRAIHIHEYGDISDGCSNVGSHFNPFGRQHGDRLNNINQRHVGDLGNYRQNGDSIQVDFQDDLLSVIMNNPAQSIIGRSIVITEGRDDLGQGGNFQSKINGNAGPPLTCCTIGHSTGEVFVPQNSWGRGSGMNGGMAGQYNGFNSGFNSGGRNNFQGSGSFGNSGQMFQNNGGSFGQSSGSSFGSNSRNNMGTNMQNGMGSSNNIASGMGTSGSINTNNNAGTASGLFGGSGK